LAFKAHRGDERPRLVRLCTASWLVLAAELVGCAGSPWVPYDASAPAQTLSVMGAPAVEDGRALFCGLLREQPDRLRRDCGELLHRLSDEPALATAQPLPASATELRVLFVPGLFTACRDRIPLPFEVSLPRLQALGYSASVLDRASGKKPGLHAQRLAESIAREPLEAGRLILVGHSKGAVDILQMLSDHPELLPRIAAVVSVAGAINGTPLADAYTGKYKRWVSSVPLPECMRDHEAAIGDLSYATRLNWLRRNPLPPQVRAFSVVAYTSPQSVSGPLRPVAAALAQIDPRNDGELIHYDQVIPGSTLLGYVNADHWSVSTSIEERRPALATFVTGHNYFPRDTLLEAILLYVGEALREPGAQQ
jgi:pimeloyl-ACP methyl ester carboxylesterase